MRAPLKKVFPHRWTFLLREAAMYSFVVLIVTGTFLALFFQPGMRQGMYHGPYTRLSNVPMSQAYASTRNIRVEVRGGSGRPRDGLQDHPDQPLRRTDRRRPSRLLPRQLQP